jgi:hypothetical protein
MEVVHKLFAEDAHICDILDGVQRKSIVPRLMRMWNLEVGTTVLCR